MKKNDFLRQVFKYEYPTYEWDKVNYQTREDYKDLVVEVVQDLEKTNN